MRRPARVTEYPAEASASATARPIPLRAPVTNATFISAMLRLYRIADAQTSKPERDESPYRAGVLRGRGQQRIDGQSFHTTKFLRGLARSTLAAKENVCF